MDIAKLLPNDPYMALAAEAERLNDSFDSVTSAQGLEAGSRATLSDAYYEALLAKNTEAVLLHPTTWIGRTYKLVEAKRACHPGSEISETAPYLAAAFDELIRSMGQKLTRRWLKQAKKLYDQISFMLGHDEYCCRCLASVIASGSPAVKPSNDNGRLRRV